MKYSCRSLRQPLYYYLNHVKGAYMDFRQLEAFCAIVEWGTFSEAARHLYITQPTISNHITSLEKTLNTRLLDRTTKSIALTEDGKQFYEYARSLIRLRQKTLQTFDKTRRNIIELGASSIPSAYILPEILSAYREKIPEIVFDITQSDSLGILKELRAGNLDIGITGSHLSDEHFCCTPIYHDEMVLVTPNTPYYRDLKDTHTSLERLLQEPYLMRENGSNTRKRAEQFLDSIGLDTTSLHIVAHMNDLESIKQSIIYGLGISILSKKVTKDLEKDHCVLTFPLSDTGISRDYYLIYRKSRIINRQLWDFINFVENYYQPQDAQK